MKTMLFNPFNGLPRHPSDIASDPEGILMLDPNEPVKAAPTAVEPDERAAILAHLKALKDDAAAHIWPDDLERCQTSECVVQVASVRMGSPTGVTVPLFTIDQVAEAIDAARASKGEKS